MSVSGSPLRALRARAVLAALALLAGCGGSAQQSARERDALSVRPSSARPPGPPPTVAYAPWPGFGHDARHSASARVVGPQDGRVRWRRRLEGPVVPGPAVGVDGTVYAASNGGVLHALDPASGRDRWRFDGRGSYGSDLSTTPLLLRDGTVLWPGPGDTLFALDGATGRLLWRLAFDAMVLSPARGPDGTIYVADMGGGLRALDVGAARPRARWAVRLGAGTSYASPAVAGDGTVYGAVDRTLVAVRGGAIRWRFAVGAAIEVSPAVAPDGTVVVGSNDRRLYGVTPAGGERWRHELGGWTYSSPGVSAGGLAYVGTHRGVLEALDARTGRLVARHVAIAQSRAHRDVGVWTAPAVDVRGDVYFGTRVGHVYGFTHAGRRLLDVDTGATVDSYPALGPDGTLYVGSENGSLYAIG